MIISVRKQSRTLFKFSLILMSEFKINYGNKVGLWDSSYAKYIFSTQDRFSIIDLQWTLFLLKRIVSFIVDLTSRGGSGLFIEKESFGEFFLEELAKVYGQQSLIGYWPGGLLCNFKEVIKKKNIYNQDNNPLLNKQTYSRKAVFFTNYTKIPNYVYVFSLKRVFLPIQEAFKLGIPTIGIVDSNIRPYGLTYFIPGNDEALKSIVFYAHLIFFSIFKGNLLKRIKFKNKILKRLTTTYFFYDKQSLIKLY